MIIFLEKDKARFWGKVEKLATECGCWLWTGTVKQEKPGKDYGSFRVRRDNKLRRFTTHRLSYFLAFGEIPKGAHVCHRCDTPACVNPAHLFLSTHLGNIEDKTVKNRCWSKLNKAQISEVRSLYRQGGWTHQDLADMHEVSRSHITNVLNRKYWKHL